MGLLDKHRDAKAEREHEEAIALAKKRQSALRDMLTLLRGGQASGSPLMTKNGERVFGFITGAGLVEPRHAQGHWVGHSQGVSVPIGDSGIHLRVGQSRGHYVQGKEEPTIIDRGTATITNQRVVFQGAKRNQEWAFAKLNGFQHDLAHHQTSFQVSNRQKVSGVSYGKAGDFFRTRLALGLAVFEGDTSSAIAEIEAALQGLSTQMDALEGSAGDHSITTQNSVQQGLPGGAELELSRPSDPPGDSVSPVKRASAGPAPDVPLPTVAPGWYPDPTQRYAHRWWDGSIWTARVGDGNRELTDPL